MEEDGLEKLLVEMLTKYYYVQNMYEKEGKP